MKKLETGLSWLVAIIFLQTLFFKFTGAPESKWIFSQMGMEPWGRYFSGCSELVAALLLFTSRYKVWGAILGLGIMGGAILSHIFILGISIQGDGGLLFSLAITSFAGCAFILVRRYKEIPFAASLGFLFILPGLAMAKVDYNKESDSIAHGYDTVSYVIEQKAIPGKKEFFSQFEGATFLFSTALNKEKFNKDPSKFIPAYGGWCAYAMAEGEKVDIDPKSFKLINGKTYLFYNGLWGNTLEKWNKKEAPLKTEADAHWMKLIK